jgi:hypothetical protein
VEKKKEIKEALLAVHGACDNKPKKKQVSASILSSVGGM